MTQDLKKEQLPKAKLYRCKKNKTETCVFNGLMIL